ncbi:MAG: DUF6591 domain-containing protein [Bacteroidia bacterium]
MKTSLLSSALLAASLYFGTGCKSERKDFDLNPSAEAIKGGLKEYIDLVPGSYKLNINSNSHELELTVKLKSKQKTNKEFQEVYNLMMSPLSIQLLDDKGNPPSFGGKMSYMEGSDKIVKLLKEGEENFFKFSRSYTDKELEDVTLTQFFLNTNATEYANTEPASSGSTSTGTAAPADCDQFLKEYEAFINSYIKLLKKYKANPTDPGILSEYSEAAQKATEMQSSAEGCSEMKDAQKIVELNARLAEAML